MSSDSRGKILVVGSGIAGLSTAWALTRRGFAVEVFDQGPVPNARSSSYDEHRITRHAYGLQGGYARMMPAAFAAYDALFADIGTRPFDPTPMLNLVRDDEAWLAPCRADLDAMGIANRLLTPDAVALRFPMVATEGLAGALESEGAGVLYPTRILLALVIHLASRGVTFHPAHVVTAIDAERATVQVGDRTFGGDGVVVAAGAWVDRLVPSLRGAAVPSRQTVMYLAPPPALAAAWNRAPVFMDLGQDGATYTLPPRPGTRLKIGDHRFTRAGDPDGDRSPTEEEVAPLVDAARRAYRDFDRYTILETKACFYTVTADEAFIVRPLGARTIVVSACSGHGFKLAPLIGEGVAAAIAGERAMVGLEPWAAGRA